MYGEGISIAGDVLDTATDMKFIDKAGSWYSYEGERIGQGRENVKEFLISHPDILETLKIKIMDEIHGRDEDDLKVDEDGVVIE